LARDLTNIITELEQQAAAIDRALVALRAIGGESAPRRGPGRPKKSVDVDGSPAAAPKKRVLSSEGRKHIIAALKKRWAEKKAAKAAPVAKKRRGLTAAGRKRLSEMMKARWASNNPPKKRSAA